MKNCLNCRRRIIMWKTKTMSGTKCENGCSGSHTLDQYPFDFQTQEQRGIIIKKENISNPLRLTDQQWADFERKYGYVI